MASTSDVITKDVLMSQIPELTEEIREERKKESLRMIFDALKHRLNSEKTIER